MQRRAQLQEYGAAWVGMVKAGKILVSCICMLVTRHRTLNARHFQGSGDLRLSFHSPGGHGRSSERWWNGTCSPFKRLKVFLKAFLRSIELGLERSELGSKYTRRRADSSPPEVGHRGVSDK